MDRKKKKWDVFIAHASEDKEHFVRPLALSLRRLGVSVWYDEFTLKIGDSLSRSIDKGLAQSQYGLVIISPAFIGKAWPERELSGLVSRGIDEDKVILPVWHDVKRSQVLEFSPPLADKISLDTSKIKSQDIVIQLLKEIRPDLYNKHPRAKLEKIASGEALKELQHEFERVSSKLISVKEELSQFQCPYCQAPLVEQISAPIDSLEKHWDQREIYECGYTTFAGFTEHLCPLDPNFPELEEYEFMSFNSKKPDAKWCCIVTPKTALARQLPLSIGYGSTKEEAEQSIRKEYQKKRTK